MKYTAQRNRLAALQRQLPGPGTRLVITGGLPPNYAPAQPKPPGSDLKHQHAAFAKPRDAPDAARPVLDTPEGVKIAGRGS
jgi:hypothetical protein